MSSIFNDETTPRTVYYAVMGEYPDNDCANPELLETILRASIGNVMLDELCEYAQGSKQQMTTELAQALKNFGDKFGGVLVYLYTFNKMDAEQLISKFTAIEHGFLTLARNSKERRDYYVNSARIAAEVAVALRGYVEYLQ